MLRPILSTLFMLICVIVSASCGSQPSSPTPEANLPNPASVYCEEHGGRLDLSTGICTFPDGSQCDEWAYVRGECQPGDSLVTPNPEATSIALPTSTEVLSDRWSIYLHETAGFSFQVPPGASVDLDQNGYTVYVNGPVVNDNSWPVFVISYPNDRPDYRVPPGADLHQWLVDHNLYLDQPQADMTIAGSTAVHTRFSGGPQSFPNDRFFFVHDGQLFVIVIIHTGNLEDWALYNRFLSSFQFVPPTGDPSVPTPIPTALPIDPALYEGWGTYTHPVYGFTIMLPDTWIIDDSAQDAHLLMIRPVDQFQTHSIRLTFRRIGEDALLWPTGVGQGELLQQGTLDLAGLPLQRLLLVCPTGEVTSIWYHQDESQPNITIGDMEFGVIFSASPSHCETGYSLSGNAQLTGEMIIASLRVP